MNHHARSYSEQPQVAPMSTGNNQHQSFIRHHSDSQQSLDQLFNLSHQPSVPLRNRNLPQSFFNPGTKASTEATNGTSNGHTANDVHMSGGNNNNLHMRSISFDQHQPVPSTRLPNQRLNLHTRTHSTIVPMPRLLSNHSSQEFLNGSPMQQDSSNNASANNVSSPNHNSGSLQQSYQHNHQNHNHSHHHSNNHTHHTLAANGWSSTGNSMDDLPTSPQWSTAQTVSSMPPARVGTIQQQAQLSALNQPVLPEAAPMQQASHQQPFYSAHSIPATEASNPVHAGTNNVHSRSFSYNQRPETQMINHGFHMRTHSTIAPMSSGACNLHQAAATVASHQSSHQSSQDFLNHSSATTASAVWSSSGYSTDDMTANGHCWNGGASGPPASQLPMAPAAPMVNSQGPATLHHNHHHQHVQPVVTQTQEPQSQQLFYQQV